MARVLRFAAAVPLSTTGESRFEDLPTTEKIRVVRTMNPTLHAAIDRFLNVLYALERSRQGS